MKRNLDEIARDKHVFIESDGTGFRRAARTLQSIWREEKGYPIGMHEGKPLGSRLDTTFAERELANFLTDGIRQVVKDELNSATQSQLYSKPRIYDDLLSSQPLCFNLFGEMKLDLGLATEVFKVLRPREVSEVTGICFEHSPGRSDERYLGDKTAFDVFIEYRGPENKKGFIGIEVKYHENLMEPPSAHHERYDAVADKMQCFKSSKLPDLRRAPLQQLWRDHLLAGSMIAKPELGYSEGIFVLLYPAANHYCRAAVCEYRRCLLDSSTFEAWTLEELVGVLSLVSPADWIEEFRHRYLDFSLLSSTA